MSRFAFSRHILSRNSQLLFSVLPLELTVRGPQLPSITPLVPTLEGEGALLQIRRVGAAPKRLTVQLEHPALRFHSSFYCRAVNSNVARTTTLIVLFRYSDSFI